jgi:hypothetical protein
MHSFLNFQVESNEDQSLAKATFQSFNGSVYGILVKGQTEIKKLLQLASDNGLCYDPYAVFE